MDNSNKQIFILNLLFIVFLTCDNPSVGLPSNYKKASFNHDFQELLENKEIDSLTYFRGLTLKEYADKNKHWGETMKYEEIIAWVNSQTKIDGNINQQLFKDGYFKITMNKEYLDSKEIDFELDVKIKNFSHISENDTLRLWISHQNLAGEQTSGVVVSIEISEEKLLSKNLNHKYSHELDDYKDEFPSWKYSNLELIPEKYFGKFCNFKILKYFLIRKDKVIHEIDLQ